MNEPQKTVGETKSSSSERGPKGVFAIIENDRLSRPIFRRIGTAFVNRDRSLNVVLEALPVSGRLHIRDTPEKPPGANELGEDRA